MYVNLCIRIHTLVQGAGFKNYSLMGGDDQAGGRWPLIVVWWERLTLFRSFQDDVSPRTMPGLEAGKQGSKPGKPASVDPVSLKACALQISFPSVF